MQRITRRRFCKVAGATIAAWAAAATAPGCAGFAERGGAESPDRPTPNPAQLAWQEAELGVVFHYDLHIFDDDRYVQSANRRTIFEDPNLFAPPRLDTDQWVDAARACGARFALITASHETGFRLWQSDANPFSLRAVRWGGGRRDVVGEFVESCRSAGIRPGIYVGARWNGRLGVHDFRVTDRSPVSQGEYNRLIEQEVEELCTRYGELFELWFDGGILSPDAGGPDVLPIVERHQPACLFYHSDQRRDARWAGNESGTAGDPCWATVDLAKIRTGAWNEEVQRLIRHGDSDGKDWCPAMADAPLRDHEWFWEPGDEAKIRSVDDLVEMYYRSVGRNATLILGVTPDARGLVPDADHRRLAEFGHEIRHRFEHPIAMRSGRGSTTEVRFPKPARVDHVVLMEDIAHGERIRSFEIVGYPSKRGQVLIARGESIGQKRILRIEPRWLRGIRADILRSDGTPLLRSLAAYSTGA